MNIDSSSDEESSYLHHVITGCKNPKHVALTFDDGVSQYTDELLDILGQNRIKATFFVLGNTLVSETANKKTLIRMVREGHVVGSHSYDHPDLTELKTDRIEKQMTQTDVLIQTIIGVRPRFMRPPYGYVNEKVVNNLISSGYLIVNWNHDTNDWKYQGKYENIVNYVRDEISLAPKKGTLGPIILQHDSLKSSIKLQTEIIRILRKKGYRFVTMYECTGERPYRL